MMTSRCSSLSRGIPVCKTKPKPKTAKGENTDLDADDFVDVTTIPEDTDKESKMKFLSFKKCPEVTDFVDFNVEGTPAGVWYNDDDEPVFVCLAVTALPPWTVLSKMFLEAQAYAYSDANDVPMNDARKEVKDPSTALSDLDINDDFSLLVVVKGHPGMYRFSCADDVHKDFGEYMMTHMNVGRRTHAR